MIPIDLNLHSVTFKAEIKGPVLLKFNRVMLRFQIHKREKTLNMRRGNELGMLSGTSARRIPAERGSSKEEESHLKWPKLPINVTFSPAASRGLAVRCDAVQAGAVCAKGLRGDHGAELVRPEH